MKETEYNQACQEKKQIISEVEVLKTEIQINKEKRSELVMKMREEKLNFNQEKKQLLISEQILKKKERNITNNYNKLEHQLTNKERVWKQQLESKDRETKKLQELIKKQQVVQEMKSIASGGGIREGSTANHNCTTNEMNYNTRTHMMDIKVSLCDI